MNELYEFRESAALSAGGVRWQSVRCAAVLLAVLALALAVPAQAVPGGRLTTMKRGNFACEVAGDAMGEPGIRQASEDFSILHSSIYRTASGRGSYLMTGDMLIMTTGPKKGERYKQISENFLHQLTADGKEGGLRCIRRVMNNQ